MKELTPEQIQAFNESLELHIGYVRQAGHMIGVHNDLLKAHDESKYSEFEHLEYARQFQGAKDNPNGFAMAWLHHVHNNPHHWQYWIFPDRYTPNGSSVENGIVEMPYKYALEMIADWMGASMAYTGSWDMSDWLYNNIPRISVHSKTADFLRERLDCLGYADIVWGTKFKNEQ